MAAGLAAALVAGGLLAGGATLGSGGATASAGTVAGAAPAPAPPQPVWWKAWCATGQITDAAYDDEGWIVVTGTAVMCDGYPWSQFTVVPFWPDRDYGMAVADQLVTYAPIGEPTGFRAVLTANATQAEAVCLITTARGRDQYCVTLAEGPDGTLTVSPLPADSGAGGKPVRLSERLQNCDPHNPNGICATCVGVTPLGSDG
jgi:hypothetical protein